MSNMAAVIVPKSDQINADDLIGGDMTITIQGVDIRGGQEQPVSIRFEGSSKVYRPCKSMSRVLVAAWGADANAYVGRSLVLYRDPNVKWGGMAVGGIRIRAMSHIQADMTMMLTESKANRKPHRIAKLDMARAQSNGPTADQAVRLARAEAAKGTDSFRAWYNSEIGKSCRATGAIAPIMAELQKAAADFDAAPPATERPTATDTELHGAIAAEHASQFQGVLDSIRLRIADGESPAELRDLFSAEIDAARVNAPEIYAQIEAVLNGALA